jgi:tetratricopeptide (TPR) repeat protein
MADYNRQVQRNLTGIKLEKLDRVDEAIRLYEANVRENFDGSHPYNRLAVIYRKRKQIDDEIRVLERAIWVYENIVLKERDDRELKLAVFKKRLSKARQLKLTQEHNG